MKRKETFREHYDLLSATAPKMPRNLPGFVKHLISRVPEHMKADAANALFPGICAHMANVDFRYVDNVLHEAAISHGTCMESGGGKGYVDSMNEAIVRDIKLRDKESERKLEEYSRLCKKKGANAAKPDRPLDAPILCPDPDMTNPAFIMLLQDAERAGNKSLYCNVSEVDMLNDVCGSHKKLAKLIRNMTDKGKTWGAHRATVDGVSGRPTLRWRFNFSCVPSKARQFFRDCIEDGTLWRLDFNYTPKPAVRSHGIPRQGNYDEEYFKKLDEYLIRLSSANGEIKVPRIGVLVNELAEEMASIADLSENEMFDSIYHRSLTLAWLKGCVLYVAEGYRWTRQIADFVRWSLYYDIWSKIQIFAPQLKTKEKVTQQDVRKYGPTNMLDMLGESFSQGDLEQLRLSLDKPTDCYSQLKAWESRGYITHSSQTGLYTKTEGYIKRHSS